jgi:hypothetical protein
LLKLEVEAKRKPRADLFAEIVNLPYCVLQASHAICLVNGERGDHQEEARVSRKSFEQAVEEGARIYAAEGHQAVAFHEAEAREGAGSRRWYQSFACSRSGFLRALILMPSVELPEAVNQQQLKRVAKLEADLSALKALGTSVITIIR